MVFSEGNLSKLLKRLDTGQLNIAVNNIAFYDDALLIDPSKHFIPIMKEVIKKGIHCNFHTPNAIHIKEINEEVAEVSIS